MKKILSLLLVLCTFVSFSQTYTPPAYAEIDDNYRNYVNNVFGLLESSRVPTGILVDYGFDFTEPKIYNGVVLADSTLMEQGIYSELYKTLYTSRFNTAAAAMTHPSVQDSLCYIARQKEVITLSGLLFKYNAIDPNAQANGKMQTVNGQLKDVYVNGVWQNPYQEFTTVAMSPSIIAYDLTYCSVTLPSGLFKSNISNQLSNIQFDAGDGQGYRALQFDVPLNLNYADTGWKHWIFRINLTGGQQLYSHSKVHFNNTGNMAGGEGTGARGVIDRRATIVATESFNGVLGVADIIISHRSANDQVIRRPLIIVEGFDPGHITKPEAKEGENTFDAFIRSIRGSGSNDLRNLISGNNIFDPNSPSEYDIIYVNWRNGTDFLQRNALVLEEVIRWVNANKQPLNGIMQPNVVLGSSMGGVIARMALGRMDRNGGVAAHQTRLYVSVDAPHQGANVPLGYQAAARHATRAYVRTGLLAALVETIQMLNNGPSPLQSLLLADQPAAKQMLMNRINIFYATDNTVHQQFMQELRTQWAYPVNIRNIAISNGSECATDQEFSPGSTLLFHYRSTKTRFIGDLLFMAAGAGLIALNVHPVFTLPLIVPGTSKFELTLDIKSLAIGGGNTVYYANVKIAKKVLWLFPVNIGLANKTYNAPTNLLPFDTYPGGFYTLTLSNKPGSVSQDWMFSYDNSFFIQRRFSFIPTTSSLDIGGGNATLTPGDYVTRYVGATPPTAPYNSPFNNFTTAFNTNATQHQFTNNTFRILNNEPHTQFYIRNANWLAAELNRANPVAPVPLTNCSFLCNLSVTGSDAICDNGAFSVPAIAGATYAWSVNNTFLINAAPNGNTLNITRRRAGNGTISISVQINTQNCGSITLSKSFQFGAANTVILGPYDAVQHVTVGVAETGKQYYFIAGEYSAYFPASNYTWTLFPPTGNPTLYAGTQPNLIFDEAGPHTLQVDKTTDCGVTTSSITVYVQEPISGFRMVAAPNPVTTDVLTVSIDNENSSVQSLPEDGDMVIELFHFNTATKQRQWILKNKERNFNLNLNSLTKGNYILRITKGNFRQSKHIIVQ